MYDRVLYATHPDSVPAASQCELRDRYLIKDMFRSDAVILTYVHQERLVVGEGPRAGGSGAGLGRRPGVLVTSARAEQRTEGGGAAGGQQATTGQRKVGVLHLHSFVGGTTGRPTGWMVRLT